MSEYSVFLGHLPDPEVREVDWEDLWGATGVAFIDHPAICDVANDEAIDYAADKSGSTNADLPENQQRQTYYEMGYRLGRVGATLKNTLKWIQEADISVWAEDDYTLGGIQAEGVVDGFVQGNIQRCVGEAQKLVEGHGPQGYEDPHEYLFAAAVEMVRAYVHIGGDHLDGTLDAIRENIAD